jgi:hypothetical protein
MPGWLVVVLIVVVCVGLLFWGSYHRGYDGVETDPLRKGKPPRDWHVGGGGG